MNERHVRLITEGNRVVRIEREIDDRIVRLEQEIDRIIILLKQAIAAMK